MNSVTREAVVKKHDIAPDHIFNLDEAGMDLGKYADGRIRHKLYARRGAIPQERMLFFATIDRATISGTICENGCVAPPMFVL